MRRPCNLGNVKHVNVAKVPVSIRSATAGSEALMRVGVQVQSYLSIHESLERRLHNLAQ